MGTPKTMMIDDTMYIRADSVTKQLEIGEKRIIVADRGWVFVGDCSDNDNGTVTIRNAKTIRRWGTTKGLGELANGPLPKTILDECGTVKTTPMAEIAVEGGW